MRSKSKKKRQPVSQYICRIQVYQLKLQVKRKLQVKHKWVNFIAEVETVSLSYFLKYTDFARIHATQSKGVHTT